jgi:pilus assembly protein CpaC
MRIREESMTIASYLSCKAQALGHGLKLVAVAGLLCVVALPTMAASQNYLKVSDSTMGGTRSVQLDVNKSMIIDLPTNVGEVIASQPAVANVLMRTKTRAIVQGIAAGDTNIFFLDGAGNNIAVLDMQVIPATSDLGTALETAIAKTIPGSHVQVQALNDHTTDGKTHFVLTHTVLTAADKANAEAMATQLSADDKPTGSLIQVIGPNQVKLKVQVAEVNRDAVKQLGINLNNGSLTVGAVKFGFSNTPSQGGASGVANSNGISASIDTGNFTLDASLRALERRGALRTLAAPTLTAMSGQQASFLAGGEFPVPTDVAANGTVTFTFKEFGVKLTFTPTVKSNGIIGLVVDTSVSELTTEGGISANGITIPATKKRQATTTVELPAGSTLGIAGMLQDTIRQQINKFPGLGNIPILGALFRSRDFIHSQTELVILVTPYIAEPNVDIDKPTDHMVVAGDAEAIFLGHMEKMYGVGSDGMRGAYAGNYTGSVGFVLD